MMKEFLLSVLASLIAAVILISVTPISRWFVGPDMYLDAGISADVYGQLNIVKIVAHNHGEYGIDPLILHTTTDGKFLRLAIRQTDRNEIVGDSPTNSGIVTTSLGTGESLELLAIIEGGDLTTELKQVFQGEYTAPGKRGMPNKYSVPVRTMAEAQLARYAFAAKIAAGFVVLVTIGTIFLLVRRWWRRRSPTRRIQVTANSRD